jgi:hypothetical protein
MMVLTIDHGNLRQVRRKMLGERKAAEPGSENHNMREMRGAGFIHYLPT